MTRYRRRLPQLGGGLFLTDAGLETDLIFNHGVELREFAAHTALPEPAARAQMARYFREFLDLARRCGAGFVLDCVTWRAQIRFAEALGATEQELRTANREAVRFAADLREEFEHTGRPIVLNGAIGPCGDAYNPESLVSVREAEDYHALQMSWLAETELDMVTALTFTQAAEAIGAVNAARRVGLPVAVSFTVETDGRLPTGQPIGDAIAEVDAATGGEVAYFMINCAHPDHFMHALEDENWLRRLQGLRCNASRCSHAELDEAEELDAGDPEDLGRLYREMVTRMPWVNVLGGCCGSDLRHVTAITEALEIAA